ncbi:hypothetical protein BJH93_00930 [Kocuria polaris]|nr:hypothetical protein [Kocuria polaris]
MKNAHLTRSAAVLAIAALGLAGCTTPNDDADTATAPASQAPTSTGAEQGDGEQTGAANEADIAFATGMIVHHRQAIEMSGIVLGAEGLRDSALGRETADLAVEIKKAQGPEIGQMEKMLGQWGAREDGHGDHGDMHGMIGEEDLDELREASGEEAARLFLEQMIAHHDGAVEMAQTTIADGQDPEARALAQEIIDAQNAEIAKMRSMLEG